MLVLVVTFLCSILNAAGLSTSGYNYINDLVGGRATGLGGAYTALSDDPSGAFYNPAGMVFAVENQISLSVNSYKNRTATYEKVIGDHDYEQQNSSFYPSFFGVVQSVGNFKVAFTFVSLNNENLDQDSYFDDLTLSNSYPATYTMNYNIIANTILAGPSLASFVTNYLSFGFSLYGMQYSSQEIAYQLVTYKPNDTTTYYELENTYITEKIYGVRPVAGLQYMPTSNFTLGFSAMLGFVVDHTREVNTFTKKFETGQNLDAVNADGRKVSGASRAEASFDDSQIPSVFRLGAAWLPDKRFLVTGDIIATIGDKNYQEKAENTFNIALGAEYYVTSSFPLRAGVFTNMASTPELSKNTSGQPAHVNLLGVSTSFSWETRNSSVTVAGYYQSSEFFGLRPLGEGEAQVYGDESIQKMDVRVYSIALTGSAKY